MIAQPITTREPGALLIGKGAYSFSDAARLIGRRPQDLRRWALGYHFSYRGQRRYSPPILLHDLPAVDGDRFLTFTDLIELLFIALFRREGVSVPVIRRAAEAAARILDTDQPFAAKSLHTDGKRIFLQLEQEADRNGAEALPPNMSRRQLLQELHTGQQVIEEAAQPYFRRLEYDGALASLFWPFGKDEAIVLDPQRAFGQPIDAASGVPTHVLASMAHAGSSIEVVARWYAVQPAAVKAAIEFERTGLLAA